MKEFEYTITDELGIHARPAGLLVKKAAEFASTVSVDNGTKKGDAKKIMSLMMMAVKQGQTVKFTIEMVRMKTQRTGAGSIHEGKSVTEAVFQRKENSF